MPLITGFLTDPGVYPLAEFDPQIVFILNSASVQGQYILATKPVIVIPNPDGSFSVEISSTENMQPVDGRHAHYKVRVEWREPDLFGADEGFMGFDWIDNLVVPFEGGFIGDLVPQRAGGLQVWVSPGGIIPAGAVIGDRLYNPINNMLYRLG